MIGSIKIFDQDGYTVVRITAGDYWIEAPLDKEGTIELMKSAVAACARRLGTDAPEGASVAVVEFFK